MRNPTGRLFNWRIGSAGAAGPQGIAGSARYLADPWRPGALDAVTGSVLLIGTGLTAIDVALALADRGIVGPIRAVSRHGLLPRSHRPAAAPAPALPSAPTERTVRSLIERLLHLRQVLPVLTPQEVGVDHRLQA